MKKFISQRVNKINNNKKKNPKKNKLGKFQNIFNVLKKKIRTEITDHLEIKDNKNNPSQKSMNLVKMVFN